MTTLLLPHVKTFLTKILSESKVSKYQNSSYTIFCTSL